jgi:predicted amidophosphoribosyltransferase
LAENLGAENLSEVLVKHSTTTTQTNKSRFNRFTNVERIFHVETPEILRGKNVLIVDDVLTTGATIRAAAEPILECGVLSLSVATIAIALK